MGAAGLERQERVFLSINRNKRSLAVDLDSKEGLEIVVELANRADVVVETFRPGSLRKRSLDYDDLRVADPGLIYCSISAYGRVGTLHQAAGYDRVVQAGSGSTSLTGHPDRPPSRLGISAIDLGASLWATIGVQSALLKRRETGQGCRIDTVCMRRRPGGFRTTSSFTWGAAWCRREAVRRSLFIAPYETFATADEVLFVAAPNDNLFRTLLGVLDLDALASDPGFGNNPQRVTNRVELHSLIEGASKNVQLAIGRLSCRPEQSHAAAFRPLRIWFPTLSSWPSGCSRTCLTLRFRTCSWSI
jgi:crotonobetainyl-CoA:carnitine CoA-transferase CaiB-like acyl-CoA transferase